MSIVRHASLIIGFAFLLGFTAPSQSGAEDPAPAAEVSAEAAPPAGAQGEAATGPDCPYAGEGPCCATCREKAAKAEKPAAGEPGAEASADCPCKRRARLRQGP